MKIVEQIVSGKWRVDGIQHEDNKYSIEKYEYVNNFGWRRLDLPEKYYTKAEIKKYILFNL